MDVSELDQKLNRHRVYDNARFEDLTKRVDALSGGEKDETMSDVRNVFESGPASGNNMGNGLSAGVGGLIGAAFGSGGGFGGFGGNREQVATLDQVDSRFNSLQGQLAADSLRSQNAESTIALGAGIAGVKDAVVNSSAQNQLALCGLGHTVQSGFAGLNQTILLESARGRELQLTDALAQTRAAVAAAHNQAGHTQTQVLLNQVISGKA